MKGQYHKAVGFLQAAEDSGGNADKIEDAIWTRGTEEFNSLHADVHGKASMDTVSKCNIESIGGHLQSKDQGMARLE